MFHGLKTAKLELDVDAWVLVESRLRQIDKTGILFVDDGSRHLKTLNRLVERLSAHETPHLRLVVTVESAKWRVSPKAPGFYSKGTQIKVSVLERNDIEELVNLLDRRPEIKLLVEADFLRLTRPERVARLRDKCSADMFVCLKNIFANNNLDDILLHEFFELGPEAREVYRHVSAVQALGGFVHRQLIMRLLNISATGLDLLLVHLDGIVSEYDIDKRYGIYGWRTRHDAQVSQF